jgi:5-methylcytosine-specific restriction endonuclease McrA
MRVCSGPGCLRAVRDAVRFCDDCKPARVTVDDDNALSGIKDHTSGYDAVLDSLRKGTRWQRLRIQVVKRDPICRRCDLSLTAIVDHVVPARDAISQVQLSGRFPLDKYAGYFIRSNLQGLCRPCHGVKTLEDKAHVGEWPSVLAVEDAQPKRVWSF